MSFVGALNNAERVAYGATAGGRTTCVHTINGVCDQIRRTQYYFVTASGSLVCLGEESDMNDMERWFDRAGVHCSKELKMYMKTILPNIKRRAFVESDAVFGTTKPGAGSDATSPPRHGDPMHARANGERSAP